MKAGQALGILAGLGAINALRGGRDGAGPRFTGLMDMLDGGGAGQSGDRFEGGGLLSMLGNLFAKPLEAQDNVERIARDTSATNALTEVLKEAVKDQRNLDNVDAYNRAQADAGAQAALMSDIYDSTILPTGSGGLRKSAPVPTAVPAGLLEMTDDLVEMSSPAIDDGSEEYISGRRMYQAVPNVGRQLDVSEYARLAQGPKFSPLFAADYRDYLEYLNTGRYPRD